MASSKTFSGYPSFPEDLPIAEVPKFALGQFLSQGPETARLILQAAKDYGCFKIDMTNTSPGEALTKKVERGFSVGKSFFDQDIDKKKEYKLSEQNVGYKQAGVLVITKERRDQVETCSISKDELSAGRPDLPSVFDQNRPFIKDFVAELDQMARLALWHLLFSSGINLEEAMKRHDPTQSSATMIRFLHNPPQIENEDLKTEDPGSRAYLMGHSDGGTVTILFNVLGGLQLQRINPGGSIGWYWIRPEPGCALFMVGDAFKSFTGGEVNSCVHRVIAPPGEQARCDRYAMGYFLKPTNAARMTPIPRTDTTKGNDLTEAVQDYEAWSRNKNAALYDELRQEQVAI